MTETKATSAEPAKGRLTRPWQEMPDAVAGALREAGPRNAYDARPPFQRNDYLGWIARARKPETKDKRLRQMLEELKDGNVYMGMAWAGGGA